MVCPWNLTRKWLVHGIKLICHICGGVDRALRSIVITKKHHAVKALRVNKLKCVLYVSAEPLTYTLRFNILWFSVVTSTVGGGVD